MWRSEVAHSVKHRAVANDDFRTPVELAKKCIQMVDLSEGDVILDAFAGNDVFFNHYPSTCRRERCEIKEGKNFFDWCLLVDWIITNPPYSILDKVIEHSCEICRKGFGYLIGIHNLTPRRIEIANGNSFYLKRVHLCKVFKYFGMSVFVIFEKSKDRTIRNIISYDRTVWR